MQTPEAVQQRRSRHWRATFLLCLTFTQSLASLPTLSSAGEAWNGQRQSSALPSFPPDYAG